jgi:hypothetical protein
MLVTALNLAPTKNVPARMKEDIMNSIRPRSFGFAFAVFLATWHIAWALLVWIGATVARFCFPPAYDLAAISGDGFQPDYSCGTDLDDSGNWIYLRLVHRSRLEFVCVAIRLAARRPTPPPDSGSLIGQKYRHEDSDGPRTTGGEHVCHSVGQHWCSGVCQPWF